MTRGDWRPIEEILQRLFIVQPGRALAEYEVETRAMMNAPVEKGEVQRQLIDPAKLP
jgi:hypothetical protein